MYIYTYTYAHMDIRTCTYVLLAYPQENGVWSFLSLFSFLLPPPPPRASNFPSSFKLKVVFLFVFWKCLILLSRTETNIKLAITSPPEWSKVESSPCVLTTTLGCPPFPQTGLHFIGELQDVQMELYNLQFAFTKTTSKEKRQVKDSFCFS